MRHLPSLALRAARALFALGCGVITGATFAVLVVESRFSALSDLVWRAEWVVRGRPMTPGEADRSWMLEIEARYAFSVALLIAFMSSIIWAFVAWRSRQSYFLAALIGLVLAAVMAGISLYGDEAMITQTALIGFSGAIAGILTRAIDLALGRRCPVPRRKT
jgi:hypothetical protein